MSRNELREQANKRCGENISGMDDSMSKSLEYRRSLVCSRNRKKAHVAGAEEVKSEVG